LNPDVRAIKQFWTKDRMRRAEPLDTTIESTRIANLGPEVAGDAGEPESVSGSAPTLASDRLGSRTLRLGGKATPEESTRSASVPPGDPIPYTAGMIPDPEVFPNITHGKLFFQIPGDGTYVCSGTVVGSDTHDVVWTAGHCVTEGDGGGFFANFLFVPGYNDGAAPAGEWVGEYAVTSSQWKNDEDFRYDVAALTMAPNGSDEEIQDVVGARGIAFNQDPDQTYRSFGHPAAPPFDGELMFYCDSDLGYLDIYSSSPAPMAIGCDMTGGSSGGGWIVEDETTGEGFVHSVNSYGYETGGNGYEDTMFGPQLDYVAAAVHEAAGGEAAPDTTAPRLTNVTDGPDPFTPLRSTKKKTTIRFTLDEEADVTLTIKNKSGNVVAKVPTTRLQPNRYSVIWNGRNFRTGKVVKAGTYTYKIKAKDLAGNPVTKSGKTTVKR
jgi:V8-like Glu-specific endopeptidase